MKKFKTAFLVSAIITLLIGCKKDNTGLESDFLNATINGVAYNSTNIISITDQSTGELLYFYSLSPDSASIGLRLNPTLPAYAEGIYTFRPSSPAGAFFISLTLRGNNFRPEITWVTANESNVDYFSVESSLDGRTFGQAAIVDAAGNTTGNTTYNYLDAANWFRTLIYYRIKLVNVDGSVVYSQIVVYRHPSVNAYYKNLLGKYEGYNGTIIITNHNRQTKTVNGTFSFDVKDYNNVVKQIRNGSFRVSY